jgi:hypothetical protein
VINHGLDLADRKEAVPRWEFVTSMTSGKPLEQGIAVDFACRIYTATGIVLGGRGLSRTYETEWNETCLEGEDKGETWKPAQGLT